MYNAQLMIRNIVVLLLLSTASFRAAGQVSSRDTLELADPTIFAYKNQFFLYGTVEKSSRNGFLVYVSDDMKSWRLSDKNDGYALKKGEAFGQRGFWAPQVFEHKKKFYMAYTANEQIAIAEGDHPLGPFTQLKRDSLPSTGKQIDPFIFIDDDGKKYLYHVRLTNGNRIFVAEMHNDFSGIRPETLKECIHASEVWENTANAEWPVTEGPTVVKIKNTYYLFYSANDFRNPDYAMGYATSESPMGPWKKQSQPLLSKQRFGINGTGHGDLLKQGDQWYYVFHTHHSNLKPTPRKTVIIKMRFTGTSWEPLVESFRFLIDVKP